MLDNLLSMARVRACKTGSARTLEERSTQKSPLLVSSSKLETGSIARQSRPLSRQKPSPPPSQTQTSRPHYSQHLVECGHQGGAKRRGGQYWILCSCLSSQGKSAPLLKSGGPLAPTHRASPCSPHEVSPDPTPRGHHHGPALATRPRPCDVPRPGDSRPSGTSHSAIRIQISTNCPISLAMPTSRQQQTNALVWHSAQQMPSTPPLLAV